MIEIKVDSTRAQELFAELAAKIENTRPAMVAIAETLFYSVEENFKVGGRPAWEPLSAARINQRSKPHMVAKVMRKASWPGQILVELGIQGGLEGTVSRRATNDTAVVGANAEYAAAMQFGRPEKNIPARPFLAIQPEDMRDAEEILFRHLMR